MTNLTLPATLLFFAGCGSESQQPVSQESAEERSFQLVYQSNLAGEIEPCG